MSRRSGELGYTWGSYERIGDAPEAGYFARVWKKDERDEWRIVMDTVSPVPAGVKPLTADLMRAEEPYLEGRWAEAEAAYRQYVDAHPANAFAWNRLGTSQVQQKKYADAVKSLERAIEIGGGSPGRLLQPRLRLRARGQRRTRRSTTSNARSAPASSAATSTNPTRTSRRCASCRASRR